MNSIERKIPYFLFEFVIPNRPICQSNISFIFRIPTIDLKKFLRSLKMIEIVQKCTNPSFYQAQQVHQKHE